MSFKKVFYKNIFTVGGYSFLTSIITFLGSIATSRLLAPEEFGVLALITVFSGFVAFFKDSGVSYLIIREDYSSDKLSNLQIFSIYSGILLYLLMILLAYPIALFYGNNELIYPTFGISLVLLIDSCSIVSYAVLRKELKFSEIGRIRVISIVLGLFGTIIFAIFGFSIWSLIIGQIISATVSTIFFNRLKPYSFPFIGFKKFKSLFYEIKSMFASIAGTRILTYWSNNSDNLLIGKFYGAFDLGIYNRAYQFLTLQGNLIGGTFNSTLLPSLKGLERSQMSKEFNDVLNVVSLILFPLLVVLVFFSDTLINILWGGNWSNVAIISPYFGVMGLFFIPLSMFGSMYIMTNNEKLLFKLSLFSSVTLIALIVAGQFFILEQMVLILSLGYIIIITSIYLFFTFHKVKLISLKDVFRNWVPKMIISSLLIYAIYIDSFFLELFLCLILFVYLIIINSLFIQNSYTSLISKSRTTILTFRKNVEE